MAPSGLGAIRGALEGISAELAALPWDWRERTAEERARDAMRRDSEARMRWLEAKYRYMPPRRFGTNYTTVYRSDLAAAFDDPLPAEMAQALADHRREVGGAASRLLFFGDGPDA